MKKLLGIVFLTLSFINVNFNYVVAQDIKEKIPEWFINIQKSTENMIYARGTAVANDIVMSNQNALNSALLEICKKMYTRIEAKNNTTTSEFKCKIPKYEIEKISIVPVDNGNFRTFVVLKYKLASE